MIDERINKSLLELEKSLSKVKSAQKQVQETVDSFTLLKDKTASYVNCLNQVNSNISNLIEAVNNDYKQQSSSLDKERTTIIEACKSAIKDIENSQASFAKQCDSIVKKIDKSTKGFTIASETASKDMANCQSFFAENFGSIQMEIERRCNSVSKDCKSSIAEVEEATKNLSESINTLNKKTTFYLWLAIIQFLALAFIILKSTLN